MKKTSQGSKHLKYRLYDLEYDSQQRNSVPIMLGYFRTLLDSPGRLFAGDSLLSQLNLGWANSECCHGQTWHVCVSLSMCMYERASVRAYVRAYVLMYKCRCICTCICIYIGTYMCVHAGYCLCNPQYVYGGQAQA